MPESWNRGTVAKEQLCTCSHSNKHRTMEKTVGLDSWSLPFQKNKM
jgi:hypothetical protein